MARVDPSLIAGWASDATALIPSDFFVRMAKRESGYDAANVTHEANGKDSVGLFQINSDESPGVDLYDPVANTRAIVGLMVKNLTALANRYNFSLSDVPDDAWYYLAASHNAGLGKVYQWIDESGLDWDATKAAHSTFVTIAKNYAQYIGDGAVGGLQAAKALALEAVTDDEGAADPVKIGLLLAAAGLGIYLVAR